MGQLPIFFNNGKGKRVAINPYGSVQNAPKASAKIDRLVRERIAERVAGGESIVGPSLHYANPHPAYSGKNAMGPDGWVWKIAQDPYLVTGTGKYHSHVHGTDPSMRPLKRAPEIEFVPSKDIYKPSIDDISYVLPVPDGLDMVAPPIPAPKGAMAPVNPMRERLFDRVARRPLSFREFLERTEAKLEFQKELAAGRENHVGPQLNSIADYVALGLGPHLSQEREEHVERQVSDPKHKPSFSAISGSPSEREEYETEERRIPVPPAKPDRRASAASKAGTGGNPFNLANQKLDQQVDLLKKNPVLAKQMIVAAGRDPELFGFYPVA